MDANEKRIDHLFTSELPDNQAARWDMVTGIMDHIIKPRADGTSFVTRTIDNPEDGSHVINEGMERVTSLIKGMRSHPTLSTAPDLWKNRVNSLVESDAYHTLVNMHLAVKPQPGVDHWSATILTIAGNEEHKPFWDGVKTSLAPMWAATKNNLNRLMSSTVLPQIPRLGAPQFHQVSTSFPSKAVAI